MQAVIALCHFCETHGPRVVVTCQPMRNTSEPGPSGLQCQSDGAVLSSSPQEVCTASTQTGHHPEPSTSPPTISSPEPQASAYGDCRNCVVDPDERCNACTSFSVGPCLLTNDHFTKTSYVSSQVPLSETVFDRVKYACTRSLSCEVGSASPPEDRPLKLKSSTLFPKSMVKKSPNCDCPSKGGGRHIPEDIDVSKQALRVAEVDGHVFFGDAEHGYTLALIFRLQDSKARGFLRLFSLLLLANDMTFLLSSHDFFLQALTTIKNKLQELASEVFTREVGNKVPMPEDGARPETVTMVHKLLNQTAPPRRLQVDTKRSLQIITGDENIWNRLHRQMMWTLRTHSMRTCEAIMEGALSQDMLVMMEMDESDIYELELDAPNSAELNAQYMHNLKVFAQTMSEGCSTDLELLLKHIVTGGQVVVESDSAVLCKQLLLAFANLLPVGCIKMCQFTEYYDQDYNLLGAPLGVDVPLDADVIVLRLLANNADGIQLDGCHVEMRRRPQRPLDGVRPQLAARFKQLLLDPDVKGNALSLTLKSAREQWLSKAKLLYQLSRQHSTNKVNLPAAIRTCRATEHDQDVLLFFQRGLSKAYKQHVVETITSYESHEKTH